MRQLSPVRLRTFPAFSLFILLVAVAVVGAVAGAAPAETPTESRAEREQLAARGAVTYRVYCRTCHGTTGHGDGPVGELLMVTPSDLTEIARRSGGEFQEDQVTATIDGRTEVAAHGPREMPIWGEAFGPLETESPDEAAVTRKIREVVLYLGTIQK